MIYQTSFKQNTPIHQYGCYMMSLIYGIAYAIEHISSYKVQETITKHTVQQFYDTLVTKEYMGEDCYIKKPKETANLLFALQGGDAHYSVHFHGWTHKITPQDIFKICIGAWHFKYTHFVLMKNNSRGNTPYTVAYDPIYPISNSVRYGELKSKRIYTIIQT